jgi:hypothetical protein
MKMPSKRRVVFYLVGTGLVAVTFLIVLIITKKPSLDQSARLFVGMVLDEEWRKLYDYSIEPERRLAGLTEDAFVKVGQEILSPCLKKLDVVSEISSSASSVENHWGTADIKMKTLEGVSITLAMNAYATDNPKGGTSLLNLLLWSWFARYAINHGAFPDSAEKRALAKLEGLREDRALLEDLGIKGLIGARGELITWDDCETAFSRAATGASSQ